MILQIGVKRLHFPFGKLSQIKSAAKDETVVLYVGVLGLFCRYDKSLLTHET
jgi:hypothetical protein